MLPILILIRPLDLLTGERVDIRIGSAPEATALGLDGQFWEPLIYRRPRIAQDLMSLDLDGKFKLAAADLAVSLGQMRQYKYQRLSWSGAPITIWSVADLSWQRRVVEFAGLIVTPPIDRETKRLTINAAVDRTRIDKPLLTREFNGDGQAGGGPEMRGKFCPAGFGYVENVEWTLFDSIYNIGMLDGYGNLIGVNRAMEGLNDLGASVGDYPTYAALKAAIIGKAIPAGRWGTCIAEGMVGLGAPPAGRITFIATFGLNRTGAIMKRIALTHAGIPAAELNTASFDALDASANYEVRAYFRDQIQCSEVIEDMARPLNATPLITAQNSIAITLSSDSAPVATLNRSASVAPLVTGWRIADPIVPIYTTIYRAERPADVLSYDEVNYVDDLIDRGLYNLTETYRAGNMVWLNNKSQWLYINAVPTSGNPPPAGTYDLSPYWQNLQPPTTAADILYGNGQTVQELQPATPGATAGAPPGTYVGDKEAAAVVAQLNLNGMNALYATALGTNQAALLEAVRNLQDGSALTVQIANLTSKVENPDQNAIQTLNLIGAVQPNGNGGTVFVIGQNTAIGSPDKLIGQTLDVISTQVGGHEASITSLKEIVTTPNGSSELRALMTLNQDGHITGTVNTLTGGRSRFSVLADEFRIVSQDASGLAYTPFSVIDGQIEMIDVIVRKLSYEALVPLFGGNMNQLNPNSGFQIMPGGLIMQWGRFRGTISSEVTFSIVFPMAFPTGVMSTGAMPYLNVFSNVRDLWMQNVGQPTQFGATFATQAATNDDRKLDGFDWWAWGY